MATKAIIKLTALAIFAALMHSSAIAEEFKLEFRDGTIATVDLPDQAIPWTTVSAAGQVGKKSIELKEIQSLELTESPASEKLVEVIGLSLIHI